MLYYFFYQVIKIITDNTEDINIRDIKYNTFGALYQFITHINNSNDILKHYIGIDNLKHNYSTIHISNITPYNQFKTSYTFVINDKNITMEDIYWFQYNSTYDKINIEKMIENLPILYCENERQLFNNIKYDKNLCEDYFNSLVWITHYYFKECINWRWCTKYNNSPLIENLNSYLNGINRIIYIRNNDEFTNIEQLSYIFPEDSHKLHKYTIKSDEYKMIPHLSFNRYLWECHLDFKK